MATGKSIKWVLAIVLGVIVVNVVAIFAYLQFADLEKQKFIPVIVTNDTKFAQDLAIQQMKMFVICIKKFHDDINRFPSQAEGLKALLSQPPGLSTWSGPYFPSQEIPRDPWGNEYVYRVLDEKHFEIVSFGFDGKKGGKGHNKDLVIRFQSNPYIIKTPEKECLMKKPRLIIFFILIFLFHLSTFAAATLPGIPAGLLMGWSPSLRRMVNPLSDQRGMRACERRFEKWRT